jgi:AraC family transcriptional regulator, ethanolamine operon transcriptional activator
MQRFDDFDAWGAEISGASLQLACDGVELRSWTLARLSLGSVVVQVATEGGGNICYGGNAHAGTILFLPLTHSAAHVVNGQPLDEHSLLAIPQGADFRIHVRRRAHAWCSIALPLNLPGTSAWIPRCPQGIPRLRQLVTGIAGSLPAAPTSTPAHQAAGREILTAVLNCLAPPAAEPLPATRSPLGRPRLDRGSIIRRAMGLIETVPIMPTAADLAATVGVTSRTLLRTFQESFGVPPKRYLMLRELHAVRRSLREASTEDATVAEVLTRHGVWEFGRFAARYRRQFGESPAETLRH